MYNIHTKPSWVSYVKLIILTPAIIRAHSGTDRSRAFQGTGSLSSLLPIRESTFSFKNFFSASEMYGWVLGVLKHSTDWKLIPEKKISRFWLVSYIVMFKTLAIVYIQLQSHTFQSNNVWSLVLWFKWQIERNIIEVYLSYTTLVARHDSKPVLFTQNWFWSLVWIYKFSLNCFLNFINRWIGSCFHLKLII